MCIESEKDLRGLKEAGRIVRLALEAMRPHVQPGATTAELNEIGAKVLDRHGARSAPMVLLRFPAAICISVNDEAVHGIPGDRVLQAGDVVKLDVTAQKNGYIADAARTVAVPPAPAKTQRLIACAERAFYKAMEITRAGRRVHDLGRVIEREVTGRGFSIVEGITGHGVGRAIHEEPSVPNYYDFRNRHRLTKGLVLAVEPIIAAGGGASYEADDGWTIKTKDGSLTAHFEQTIVVTKGAPLLLTAA